MSRKEHIFATTLRIDTATPEGKQAVSCLKNRDRKEFPSYSALITEAINAYFARRRALQDDPYLETRQKEDAFLREISEKVDQAIRQAEARGFANAVQMLGTGSVPGASLPIVPTAPVKQPDSVQNIDLNDENLLAALDFIDNPSP